MRTIEFNRINVLFLIGLMLAIGGCNSIFLFRGNVLYVSVFIFFIGLFIVWWSGTSTFNKLLACLLPAVVFVTIYTVSQDVRVREPEVWLLPEGYRGPVYLFLGEKCGEGAEFEEKSRVYTFQEVGILFSHHKKNYGISLQPEKFYYISSAGERRPIPLVMDDRAAPAPTDTLLVMAFPGQPLRGEAEYGRFHLQHAFIGTYRDFNTFIKTSPLPQKAPDTLLHRWTQFGKECRDH